MMRRESLLVLLVKLVDAVPLPPAPVKRRRGRPKRYPERLFLKALIIMIVRHVYTVHALLSILAEPTHEMQTWRALLTAQGRFPARRTWERRLKALPQTLPAQIGCLGRYLVMLVQPWERYGRAVACDSTLLQARGGVWHKKHRERGEVPHTSMDTEAAWTKSGWHGWVYGWKLPVVATVAAVWIPLAAELTAANRADGALAPALLREVPPEARLVLGDRHYNVPSVREACAQSGRLLVTTRYGRYPHTDDGEVRRLFHKLRSLASENFNEHFKGIFDSHGQVPTKGLANTQRFALGAIWVYQLALLYRFQNGLDLNVGLKAFLKAA
ncbi:MAG: transposase [Chloroflexi bacterium]|nr:transposase [Chloroflexota bacterium]